MDFLLNPNVAYFLLVSGFLLAMLALLAPGTGFVEVAAVFLLAMAGYGVFNLPLNLWALVILILGVFPFILAVRQSRRLIFLAVSMAALVVGSVFLFRSEDEVMAVDPLLAVTVSILVVGFLWLIVRKALEAIARVPDHSLERLTGMTGMAESDVFREGTVSVGGEQWSARSETFIPAGSQVRVVGREGLVVIVEAA
ncbi:MAG: hypothetical protein IT308_09555 [Anaerolineaceae bacterium]|nr:hypothetical protein [Anaerolineaceae bacterium]